MIANRWALAVLVVIIVAAGYLWLNEAPGTMQASPGPDARAGGDAPQASTNAPASKPAQKRVVLEDLGMVCPLCRAAVATALDNTPGVLAYEVDLKTDSATVLYDPAKVKIEDLKRAVAEAGYRVRGVREIRG